MSGASPDGAVLGLWDGHDAGVAVVADGELAFALSEERPSRRKRASGFPHRALDAALAWAEGARVRLADVAVAGAFGRAPLRVAERWYAGTDPHRDPLSAPSRLVRGWESALPRLPGLREAERSLGAAVLRARLVRALGRAPRLTFVPHHEAHAHAARLAASHHDDTRLLTWDAYGEGLAVTWRPSRPGTPTLAALPVSAGVALLYGAVTVLLGFREGDEGKVMGLAARGDPGATAPRLLALFEPATDGTPRLRAPLTRRRLSACLRGASRDDVAAGLQQVTEQLVTRWVASRLVGEPHPVRLALAGGLFANIRLNQALAGLPGVAGVQVFPHMGDGGLAAGAAAARWLHRSGAPVRAARTMLLGCAFDAARIEAAVRASGLPWRRVDDVAEAAAKRLARGEVVARYAGRDEHGPRALGNRSILFSAAHPGLGDRVNQALGRDGFMPFAPAVPVEAAPGLWRPLGDTDLGTMTVSVDAAPAFRAACPGAVHLDGTCRPQVVTPDANPGFHSWLAAARRLTGWPAVINTSFNLHGEPIVHTPEDALATFRAARLDALYLDDLEVRRPDVA